MIINIALFALGLILLMKCGDWFVDGSVGIAQKFHLPYLLIGATIVSIGTTLPEVMVSANSALSGHGEIAYGNAIGSIICNTALIAAVTIAVAPSVVDRAALKIPVVFFFVAALIYTGTVYLLGSFTRAIGIVLLLVFLAYMIVNVRTALGGGKVELEEVEESDRSIGSNVLLLVIGAAGIAVGADLLVDNGTVIAEGLGVPESVIALTFVALGTSLPELVTAISSLMKGHGSLSLGNIIGANLFNLVLVNGVSVTLAPFQIPTSKVVAGMNASLIIDIPVMLLVMLLLTVPALIRGKLSRMQGILLLGIYGVFCVGQFLL